MREKKRIALNQELPLTLLSTIKGAIPNWLQGTLIGNINVSKFCEDYVALTEVPLPVRFDLKTLATLGDFDFRCGFISRAWSRGSSAFDTHRITWSILLTDTNVNKYFK